MNIIHTKGILLKPKLVSSLGVGVISPKNLFSRGLFRKPFHGDQAPLSREEVLPPAPQQQAPLTSLP